MNKDTNRVSSASVFTLIELLIVISIIAILASMLLPALGKARDQAKGIKCMSNLKQLGVILHSYSSDFDGYIVTPIYAGTDLGCWPKRLTDYCPGLTYENLMKKKTTILNCPSYKPNTEYLADYCFWDGGSDGGFMKGNYAMNNELKGLKMARLKSSMIIAVDSGALDYSGTINWAWRSRISSRHNNMFNLLLLDGHVERMKFVDLKEEQVVP